MFTCGVLRFRTTISILALASWRKKISLKYIATFN